VRASPIRHVRTCGYCKHGTHIIDTTIHPNDIIARREPNGLWRCGDCIEMDIQNMIKGSKKRRGVTS
jgi:hypothetical protein